MESAVGTFSGYEVTYQNSPYGKTSDIPGTVSHVLSMYESAQNHSSVNVRLRMLPGVYFDDQTLCHAAVVAHGSHPDVFGKASKGVTETINISDPLNAGKF